MLDMIKGWFAPASEAAPKKRAGAISGTRILRIADKGLLNGYIGAIIAVFILDALFFMAWAPAWYLVPVFLLIGLVIRMTGVFSGPVMQVIAKDKAVGREAKTIRALSIAAGLICLIPALSFFAGGHYNQTHNSTVAVATEGVSDTNKAARIKTLNDQIARIEGDRDAAVKGAEQTIKDIVDDGVPGISPSDNISIATLRTEIQKYRNGATEQIGALGVQIGAIELEKEAIQTTSATEQAKVSPANAIFEVLGGIAGSAPIWAMTILFIFAMLLEAIAFFGLGAYQGLHKLFIEAIQRMELEEAAHEARLEAEAQRVKDKIAAEALLERANARLDLASIEQAVRRADERAEAARNGEDLELLKPVRDAQADLKAAEIERQASALRVQAETVRRQPAEQPAANDQISPTQPIPGRTGGLNVQHINRASQLEDTILVDDNRTRNAERDAERKRA